MKIKPFLVVKLFLFSLLCSTVSYAAIGVGSRIPDITLPVLDQTGKKVSIDKIDAKYLYIDFWASWCIPCRISLPKLSQLATNLNKKSLVVIGINLDQDPKNALQFLQKYPTSFVNLSDPEGIAAERFDLPQMPSAYLARDGVIIKTFYGYQGHEMDQLNELIK
ncbi:MAG: TlpA family protein disulfide reductase [Gammaproteobacteria bacterium]|nr:MAG: TlpA family protein disulfide reductase [Gammaproteobacteria bacterium]UTW42437.1 TlpA family protein disulfide reductase [bacterium SCSIO 12844]